MSAITGIFLKDKSVNLELIKKMNDTLSYRGLDGSDIWINGNAAFGHQMLHTTPESLNENLPFFDEEKGLAITADARIDNRNELIRVLKLEKSGKIITDSEIILKSYQKWGEECPEKLLGDFAFAIWDKNKEKLFCARDHMGVKPFYYHLSDDSFYFAIEIKALLSVQEIPCKLNEVKIADYIISMDEDRKNTFYQEIYRLPAAHSISIDFKKNELKQYWTLDPSNELNLGSDEEYAKAFHDIFKEAVKCRLRSAFPVGSELSGGLDSSSVSCMSQKILSKDKKRLKTFSIVFKDLTDCDESNYSKIVSKWCDMDSYFIESDGINPFEVMENPLWPKETPPSAHSMYVFWFLYKKAQEEGVRVLLNGFEGDAAVGRGNCLLEELARKKRFKMMIKEIKATSKLTHVNPFEILFYEVMGPLAPEFLKNIWKFLSQDFTYKNHEKKIINKDFAKKINLKERYEIMNEYLKNKGKNVRNNQFYELSSGFYQMILEEFDQIAAASSMEFRFPFMDKRLLEFCLSLPPDQQLSDGWDRIIMRRAMENIIPPEIQFRHDKTFFDSNFNSDLQNFGKEQFKNILNDDDSIGKYIDLNSISEVFREFESKELKSLYLGDEPYLLWKVINLYMWLLKKGT
ncbi:MAG: lasso peptide isopeptide bond-forming cyclase [Methanobacterium sp.]|uniref:lasso peptide isopeptide bond-forming cyclase n=1 Tax=Methanobacterium sp. TaxID=2164 RepID=UPI003D654C51|nr:lasso peptide isopeptide bond-forming cyclase [Methanobacterium sp.]